MSLYPSLDDVQIKPTVKEPLPASNTQYVPPYPRLGTNDTLYPALYKCTDLPETPEIFRNNVPNDVIANDQSSPDHRLSTSSSSISLDNSQNATGAIREMTLCKNKSDKYGLRVRAIDNGIFVCLVTPGSPAALSGLRFGDQILETNEKTVAGYSMDQVHKIFASSSENVKLVVRDRPLERIITMHKDTSGRIGFQFVDGKIIEVVENSSAAKNGVLTNHQILEVNGKNVVGLKDKDIVAEIKNTLDTVTISIIPSYIFNHLIKNMAGSLLKEMDHSGLNI